ncbi:acyltransferase [Streptomyces globisporus]|uniref:acyltransferase family protein n=1 Tax=Streptomyces globisporus TaxID=1908 RepID=UPI0007C46CFD|nr:acyltransferase [Streptomyces globisporus]
MSIESLTRADTAASPGTGKGVPGGTPAGGGRPAEAAAPRVSRLPTLTGLRFPAALLVFTFHAVLPFASIRIFADSGVERGIYHSLGMVAGLTMPFWFMLSGFILIWSAREGDTAKAFWRRRFAKIVPPYLVGWILALLLVNGVDGAPTTPAQGFLSFFMLQSWVPDVPTNFAVNNVSWSLSAEAFFYAAFPALFLVLKKIPAHRLKYWIGGVIAAIAATPLVTYAIIPVGTEVVPNEPGQSANYFWFAYVLPAGRLLDFALGMLVGRAVVLGRWRNIGMAWSGLLLAVTYVVGLYVPWLWGIRLVCVIPAALLIAAGAIADNEDRFTIFRNRTMVWLGEISFAFYLVHFTVLEYTRHLLGDRLYDTPAALGILLGELGVSVLLAWALYSWVEVPLTRRWSRSRKDREAAEAAKAAKAAAAAKVAASRAAAATGQTAGTEHAAATVPVSAGSDGRKGL